MARITFIANNSWYLLNFRRNTILRLLAAGHDVNVVCGNIERLQDFRSLGVSATYVPFGGRKFNLINEFRTFTLLLFALLRTNPEIVLSFNPKANLYTGFCRNFLSYRWISNVSGLGRLGDTRGIIGAIINLLFKFSYRKVDHTFFQSQVDFDKWLGAGIINSKRCSRLYGSGVDLVRFKAAAPLGEELHVVCAARLLKKKGIGHFIALAKYMRSSGLQLKFVLAGPLMPVDEGGFPKKKILEAVDLGFIEYLGYLENVVPLIRRRSVGCLLTEYNEGIPKSMIEFLACGRPLLISNFDSAYDLVPKTDKFGKVVDLKSSIWLDEAASYIKKLALDPQLYRSEGIAARSLAECRFDEQDNIHQYQKIISSFL